MKQIKNIQQLNDTGSVAGNSDQMMHHQHQSMRMAPIKIIPFDGNILQWNRYKEMFMAVADQQQPPWKDLEKFHRLKETVLGDALQDEMLINGLSYTGESFKIAWRLLETRYENMYMIASLHTQALLAIEPMQVDNGELLMQMIDTVMGSLAALESLKVDTTSWDMMTITIVSSKLDQTTRQMWETQLEATELPKWTEMTKWLQKRARILMSSNILRPQSQPQGKQEAQRRQGEHNRSPRSSRAMYLSGAQCCIKCDQQHQLEHCAEFDELSIPLKYELLKDNGICYNCLQPGHQRQECPSFRRCEVCSWKHSTLLHDHDQLEANPSVTAHVSNQLRSSQVILATAMVNIYDDQGVKHTCRALLDIGSMEHFITKELAQKLRLHAHPAAHSIEGLNNTKSRVNGTVTATIQSTSGHMTKRLLFLVVPKVTGELPSARINTATWKMPSKIKLADPAFNNPHKVDMLIGGGLFSELLKNGRIKLESGPVLLNTKLGWIVSGTVKADSSHSKGRVTTICGMVATSKQQDNVNQAQHPRRYKKVGLKHIYNKQYISKDGNEVCRLKPEKAKVNQRHFKQEKCTDKS